LELKKAANIRDKWARIFDAFLKIATSPRIQLSMLRHLIPLILILSTPTLALAEAIPVQILPGVGITRGGQPFFVKGAGGDEHLADLAAAGGNSLRTWTTTGLGAILDDAQKLGLTVCAGIWLEHECSWFSYANPEHCARQAERVKKEVMQFRDHPALLFWGIGNEVEGDGSNVAFWQQLERLAKSVKELDPAHPTFTAVAGLQEAKAAGLTAHTPSLDFVGINTYGALPGLRGYLTKIGWERPWVVTEYGPRGFWEVPRTAWGAPIEQTSGDKARFIRKAYETTLLPGGDCWGGYVFLWGQKQEATATWFGIYTATGETTAVRDVMHELWIGQPPLHRAPEIKKLSSSAAKKSLPPGAEFTALAEAADLDGDTLTWHWSITAESAGRDAKGRERTIPTLAENVIKTENHQATLKAPAKPGAYRVHLLVTDTHKQAATANFPFEVR
jgi:hypothetical protein